MKNFRKHWLTGCSKVLSVAIGLLGLAGCGTSKRVTPPTVMYGAPYDGPLMPDTTIRRPPTGEMRLMYGVPPATYRPMIEKDGVEIEINVK